MRTTSRPTTRPFGRRAFLLGAGALAACAIGVRADALAWDRYEQVDGNGNVRRQARDVGHFSAVAMALAGNVEVRHGERDAVTVEADDNLLALIETVVEDGALQIRTRHATSMHTRKLRVLVTVRQLERLSLAGSGDMDVDRLDGARMQVDIGGAGKVNVGRIEGERLVVGLGGSGDLKVKDGSARTVSISVGGSGNIELARVRAESANVTIAGSGDVTLWVRDSLSTTVMGSGNISYYGDPRLAKTSMGSGSVRRLGATPG